MKPTPRILLLVLLALIPALFLTGLPSGTPRDEPDARPAQAFERPAESVVEDGQWRVDAYGLSMPLPAGWTAEQRSHRPYLLRNPEAPLEGNFCVIALPNFRRLDLDGLLEENRKSLESNPSFRLDGIEKVAVGGVEGLWIDYHGVPVGRTEPMCFRGLVYLQGNRQIVLTATALTSEWPAIEPEVQHCLEAVEITR